MDSLQITTLIGITALSLKLRVCKKSVIKSRQEIANLFYSEKCLSKQINIQNAILNSKSNH